MSALSAIIDTAVSTVIAEHPKLFDPKQKERVQKVLTREIVRSLTREQKTDVDDESTPVPESAPVVETVAGNDPRAIAYTALRSVAGAVTPMRLSGGAIYLPPEGATAQVGAFANLPPREKWEFITDVNQIAAWFEFFNDALPNVRRRDITETRNGIVGALLPWPWPPSKTGKVYMPGEAT